MRRRGREQKQGIADRSGARDEPKRASYRIAAPLPRHRATQRGQRSKFVASGKFVTAEPAAAWRAAGSRQSRLRAFTGGRDRLPLYDPQKMTLKGYRRYVAGFKLHTRVPIAMQGPELYAKLQGEAPRRCSPRMARDCCLTSSPRREKWRWLRQLWRRLHGRSEGA